MLIAHREPHLAPKIVVVDGQPGCGKTMLSPIVSALDRVEIMTYAYELEYTLALHYLGRVERDAAVVMARMLTDLRLYHQMMGRETNFRVSDLSSAFRDRPLRYIRRILGKGDEAIPPRVTEERPILHLTTHNLLGIGEPVFEALGERLLWVEVVRHPLYMVKQQMLNMERLLNQARDLTVYFRVNEVDIPFWAFEFRDTYHALNPMEKAVVAIDVMTRMTDRTRDIVKRKYPRALITIPFEKFVLNPWEDLARIETGLDTQITDYTKKVMKRQKVPRKLVADGLPLAIYERCGWEPPQSGNEQSELENRREFVARRVSAEVLKILDRLCAEYENAHLVASEGVTLASNRSSG